MKWDADKYNKACLPITNKGRELIYILEQKQCRKVLDIGCGTGVLTNEIAMFADEVVGIDSSDDMIKKATAAFSNIEFMVMDAKDIKWVQRFDGVFSNAVFHFIKNQDQLLSNINRVLLEGGILVCEFGAEGNISDILEAFERICLSKGKSFTNRFYYPSEEEYTELLTQHGFLSEVTVYDTKTSLIGETGLRDWLSIVFNVELSCYDDNTKLAIFNELEDVLRKDHYSDGWYIMNRRIRVIAKKEYKKVQG